MRILHNRKIFYSSFIISVCIACLLGSCSRKVVLTEEAANEIQLMTSDVLTLASDKMEGREVGTKGEQLAGEYLKGRFKEIGLIPAGTNGYEQEFSRRLSKNPHGHDDGTEGVMIRGKNLLGLIDNGAPQTVIIGGHYDHLGYGEEGSLHTGAKAIHNGADDNASGTSGVLYMAQKIKALGLKKYNYLFICFSGEEKGLWGSNYYVNHRDTTAKIAYMFNMDMIGRLNKERQLAISGVGTSPVFGGILDQIKSPKFKIKRDSSGLGPSDHASFYNSGIPVLAFFTGQHADYHKPSDDYDLVNYRGMYDVVQLVAQAVVAMEGVQQIPFAKTRDESQVRMAFSVTMGVMPDYLYDGVGLKIDGVKDGKPAQVAGIIKGDIVTKMGEMEVTNIQDYMRSLAIFKNGMTIPVEILRDGVKKVLTVRF
jgi:hypothetical protein